MATRLGAPPASTGPHNMSRLTADGRKALRKVDKRHLALSAGLRTARPTPPIPPTLHQTLPHAAARPSSAGAVPPPRRHPRGAPLAGGGHPRGESPVWLRRYKRAAGDAVPP